jgi:hypothetical protein
MACRLRRIASERGLNDDQRSAGDCANQIRITHHRLATGVETRARALPKAAGRGWSGLPANVKRRRRLAREESLESIERLQRLERRKRQSGQYVPDRRHPSHWL